MGEESTESSVQAAAIVDAFLSLGVSLSRIESALGKTFGELSAVEVRFLRVAYHALEIDRELFDLFFPKSAETFEPCLHFNEDGTSAWCPSGDPGGQVCGICLLRKIPEIQIRLDEYEDPEESEEFEEGLVDA